jgi:alpha-ribazole phosphatase
MDGRFVKVVVPGGESYVQLHERVMDFLSALPEGKKTALITHAGVIRSVLSFINSSPLERSFDAYPLEYGCVTRLFFKNGNYTCQSL